MEYYNILLYLRINFENHFKLEISLKDGSNYHVKFFSIRFSFIYVDKVRQFVEFYQNRKYFGCA